MEYPALTWSVLTADGSCSVLTLPWAMVCSLGLFHCMCEGVREAAFTARC